VPDCYFILRANTSELRSSYKAVSAFVSSAEADLRNSRIYYDRGKFYVYFHYRSTSEAQKQLDPLRRELIENGYEIIEFGVAENVRFKV
jgi:hypothetical protein